MSVELQLCGDCIKEVDGFFEMYLEYARELQGYGAKVYSNKTYADYVHKGYNLHRSFRDDYIIVDSYSNKIIGFAFIGFFDNSFCGKDIYIQEFYIKPEYRRMHYGTKALKAIMATYNLEDMFSLFVLKNNKPAWDFWWNTFHRLGYSDRMAEIGGYTEGRYDFHLFTKMRDGWC